jgi:hypothetical protein
MKKINYVRNTFGIEFEFIELPLKIASRKLKELKLTHKVIARNGWAKSNGLTWDVKTDSSVTEEDINDGRCGGEVASPAFIPSTKAFKEIEMVYNQLLKAGAIFNKNCGLHIHIDITNISKLNILLTLLKYEKQLYKGFEYRTKCEYARPLKRLTPSQMNKELGEKFGQLIAKKYISKFALSNHHAAFNFYNRKDKNMIEIRMGACTENLTKTMNWIKLVLQKIRYAKYMDPLEELIAGV